MHEQVLPNVEVADVLPAHDAALRQREEVVDGAGLAVLDMLVHVIGNHEVDARARLLEVTQRGEELLQSGPVNPVI